MTVRVLHHCIPIRCVVDFLNASGRILAKVDPGAILQRNCVVHVDRVRTVSGELIVSRVCLTAQGSGETHGRAHYGGDFYLINPLTPDVRWRPTLGVVGCEFEPRHY
jgi:hypothetical protein